MAKKTHKCSKCSRSFSMSAHLARHLSAIHGASRSTRVTKKRVASVAKRVPKRSKKRVKKTARRKVGRATATQLRTGMASRLVDDMRSYLGQLTAQRTLLDAEVAAVSGALKALGTAAPARVQSGVRRGRPPSTAIRPGSLKDFVVRVLRQHSRPMSPNAIAAAVTKSGYKSQAKDLSKAVSNCIPGIKSVKRVGFGAYKT